MGAILPLLRAALPFALSIFGGYFVSDVFNERQRAKQAQQAVNYPAIVQQTIKSKADKWKFLGVAALLFGAAAAFLIKKFK